jgi:uncharacterized protein (DUF433 family)
MVLQRGAYPADRAAALSGVPISTVHYWAREEILVPSISARKVKLWSYADLMGLRVIHWLRHVKRDADGATVPRTTMPAVRRALKQLEELDLRLWSEDAGPAVCVDRAGQIGLLDEPGREMDHRQRALADAFNVMVPFDTAEGTRGPDLHSPRPRLRIVPGKLGGAPHVVHTRLESQALGALAAGGLGRDKILRLYPDVSAEAVDEALDLEQQLARNLPPAVAA